VENGMSKQRQQLIQFAFVSAFLLTLAIGLDFLLVEKLNIVNEVQRAWSRLFSAEPPSGNAPSPAVARLGNDECIEVVDRDSCPPSLAMDQAKLILGQNRESEHYVGDPADGDMWVGTPRVVERDGKKTTFAQVIMFNYLVSNLHSGFDWSAQFLNKSSNRGVVAIGKWHEGMEWSCTIYRLEEKTIPYTGVSTLSMLGAPQGCGPLLAASTLFPGRTETQRFVVFPDFKGGEIFYTYSLQENRLRLRGCQEIPLVGSVNLTGEYKPSR
jgi:hypothetical protein